MADGERLAPATEDHLLVRDQAGQPHAVDGDAVNGTAAVQPEQPELSARMSRHYLGAIAGFFYLRLRTLPEIEDDPDTIVVIEPERKYGWDYRPQTPLVGRLWLGLKRALPPWL